MTSTPHITTAQALAALASVLERMELRLDRLEAHLHNPASPPPEADLSGRVTYIQRVVATHYNISLDALLSADKHAHLITPRHVAMYLVRVLLRVPTGECARYFRRSDHGTVIHATRRVTDLVTVDPHLRQSVSHLSSLLIDSLHPRNPGTQETTPQ